MSKPGTFDTSGTAWGPPPTPATNPIRDGGSDISEAAPDNPVVLKGGFTTTDPRLDRIPQFDERSRRFAMTPVLKEKAYKPRSYTWGVADHLDQGNEGSCVGHAWAHELIAHPAVIKGIDHDYARWIYKQAQKIDEWAGESYEGTSVLAGVKIIQKRPPDLAVGRGLIDQYRWIFGDLADMEKTLGYFGPVVIGIWWWDGMWDTDETGFVHAKGKRVGGHAILVKGVDIDDKRFRLHNSWGESWGEGGDAWVSYDDMQKLLDDDGECCVPMRRHTIR